MNTDLNKSFTTLLDTGISFTRFGLSVAGAAVSYASEILKDVGVELKAASERVAEHQHPEETPIVDSEPKPAE